MTLAAPFETGFIESSAWMRTVDRLLTALRPASSVGQAVRPHRRVGRSEWNGFRHLALMTQQANLLSHRAQMEQWHRCWSASDGASRRQ